MKNELDIGIKAAREAGKVITRYYKSKNKIRYKSYKNPVTTADFEADKKIKEILMSNFPSYGWLSEETFDSHYRLNLDKVWIVDPIDGTKEFIEGIPNFAVSIGLVENGLPTIGILFNPITQQMFYAQAGKGAFLNDELIKCKSRNNIKDMTILNSRSEDKAGLWTPYKFKFKSLKPIGSVAYKLGLIASGEADAFASLKPKSEWDICAGDCIIREAGGRLINLNGEVRNYNLKDTRVEPGLIAGKPKTVEKLFSIFRS